MISSVFALVLTVALLQVCHCAIQPSSNLRRCTRADGSIGFGCPLPFGSWCNRNSSLCNGLNDCLDGSDELNCPVMIRSNLATTLAGMVSCVQDNGSPGVKCDQTAPGCAPYDYLCDGEEDCTNGQDELLCPIGTPKKGVTACVRNDGSAGYRCLATTGMDYCWPASWKCDGGKDCEDGRDEVDCPAGTSRSGLAALVALLSPVAYPLCRRTDGTVGFTCRRGGYCFPASFSCDGQTHCDNGADERNCPAVGGRSQATLTPQDPTALLRCLRPNNLGIGFKCSASLLEPCYDNSNACDGHRNCANGRDELNCNNGGVLVVAPLKPGFQACRRVDGTDGIVCPATRQCMPHAWICDGDRDCSDGIDETQCRSSALTVPATNTITASNHASCGTTEFQCTNGRCVPDRYRCDGSEDCSDRSDELNCHTRG
ncbi:putative Sortilin-related receptor [Hypsibius exemplaris]|uniref:Sortilin-related receptor n=1 Tax=Hypsibius exemplaris TaxID=2072580 RepID=A0A1W0WEE4_HYPEX|nr:putative Sortilin-related receptor [Hypsibius exemplaris]